MQKEIRKLPDSGSYISEVVLLGNSDHLTPSQLKKLVDGYEVSQFPHSRAYRDLLFPVVNGTYYTSPNLTIEINLDNVKSGNAHLDYDVRTASLSANIKLLFVPTREIGRVMHTYKNSILKFNPRSFLELTKNTVNRDIEASIVNGSGNEFAMFNNGITIISEGTGISSNTAKQGRAQVVVTNPQLVNGGQTAYTLGRLYEAELTNASPGRSLAQSKFKGKEVLLKIITFVGSKSSSIEAARVQLIRDISKASNSQTKIEESDRRSNDQIQLDLQEIMFQEYGMYYERKRGEFSDGVHSGYITGDDIVNREKLVRVSLACSYRINQAKTGVTKFFKEHVFSTVLSVRDVSKYAMGYEILQLIDSLKKEKVPKQDRWKIPKYGQALRFGEYAVVAACVNLKALTPRERLTSVLSQWMDFEAWVVNQKSNKGYVTGSTLDGGSYYKGATVNSDVRAYKFK